MKPPLCDLNIQTIDTSVKLAENSQFLTWCEATLQYALAQPETLHTHREWQITLRIVDAAEGKMLNSNYRHKEYATNVLSFYYDSAFTDLEFLDFDNVLPEEEYGEGDIILCVPVIVKEAKEQGKSLLEHTAHLTVHAVLHLLGYDHEIEKDAIIMENLEIAILHQLGINNPYEEN